MFSNILTSENLASTDRGLKSIYQKFQTFLGRGAEADNNVVNGHMSDTDSMTATDGTFMTPVSSVGDLVSMSPELFSDTVQSKKSSIESDDLKIKELPDDIMFVAETNLDYNFEGSKSNKDRSDRSKDNMFGKFDTLYTRQKLEDTHSIHSDSHSLECDVGYETGSTVSITTDSQILIPKQSITSESSFSNKEKPMQIVPPVINSGIPKSTPVLTRSVSAILTPTRATTEKLNNIRDTPPTVTEKSIRHKTRNFYLSCMSHESDSLQTLRLIVQKQNQDILQLKQDNKQLKSLLQDTENKYSTLVEDLETKVKKLSSDKDRLLQQGSKMLQQIHDKNLCNKQMGIVMEEYEKTMSSLIEEQQREKIINQEITERILFERDDALRCVDKTENSFSDLLAKYAKCKTVILHMKEREKAYVQKFSEYQTAMNKYEELYKNVKQVTSDTLTRANETLENLKKNYNVDATKLNATVKKHEMTIASLQESLSQKTKDNEELMRLYDQLISEVH